MSSTMIAHACTCLIKAPLIVDGDTDSVYHETCEGYIGDTSDMQLTDKFWNDQLSDPESIIVINGNQYRLGKPYPQKGFGFGGEHYRIKLFENSAVIDTADLWHQGTIPEQYKGILQDNASFVRLVPVVQYKQCPNCKDLMNRNTCYKTTCNNAVLTNAEVIEVTK